MTDLPDRMAIVCNFADGTKTAKPGAKAYILPQLGGNLPERVRLRFQSRGGRWIEKWEALGRLTNFRLTTIPPEHPMYESRGWVSLDAELADEMLGRVVHSASALHASPAP
jgi:hypothetical protein